MDDFLPGDVVEFMDDKTRGKIVAIINSSTLLIDIDEGLEIPVLKSKVVKVSGVSQKHIENINSTYSDEFSGFEPDKKFKQTVFAALAGPENEFNYKYYLVNNSRDFIFFSCHEKTKQHYRGITKGELQPGKACLLSMLNMKDKNKFPEYLLQMITYHVQTEMSPEPLNLLLTLKGEDLLKEKVRLPQIPAEAIILEINPVKISQAAPPAPIKPAETPPQPVINMEIPEKVVDLHIKEINPDFRLMTSTEILNFQYDYFKNALEKGIAVRYKKMIFIHGIGVSTLKTKITDYLKNHTEVIRYQEADIRKYGYGATEAILTDTI